MDIEEFGGGWEALEIVGKEGSWLTVRVDSTLSSLARHLRKTVSETQLNSARLTPSVSIPTAQIVTPSNDAAQFLEERERSSEERNEPTIDPALR